MMRGSVLFYTAGKVIFDQLSKELVIAEYKHSISSRKKINMS